MKTSTLLKSFATGLLLTGFIPTATALTATEAANILYMKQEEKLARDVYLVLNEQWHHFTFENIAVAEQKHMNAVDGLIALYGLTDTTPDEPGEFSIPELQDLFDYLVEEGGKSLADALAVGVGIEQADITDLEEALLTAQEWPVQRVFTNLKRASTYHLSAFAYALSQLPEQSTCPNPPPGDCDNTPVGSGPYRNGQR